MVLIEGISQPRAFLLANRLRHSIEENQILLDGNDLSVTAVSVSAR